jgi:hypothetical protein
MRPGDLRRFRDSLTIAPFEGSTFMVLEVSGTAGREPTSVDILIDGRSETLGFRWVRDSSEVLNEAR